MDFHRKTSGFLFFYKCTHIISYTVWISDEGYTHARVRVSRVSCTLQIFSCKWCLCLRLILCKQRTRRSVIMSYIITLCIVVRMCACRGPWENTREKLRLRYDYNEWKNSDNCTKCGNSTHTYKCTMCNKFALRLKYADDEWAL